MARTNDGGRLTLQRLYAEALDAGQLDAYRRKKWDRSEEFASWLEQPALESLEPQQAAALYRASGGRNTRVFAGVTIEELRDSLDFLLYDNIKLEGRFDECAAAHGAYKLPGAAEAFVSFLLCLHEPGLFGVWNNNSERLLRRLGTLPASMKQGPIGIRYQDVLEALGRVGSEFKLADFRQVDELAYFAGSVCVKTNKREQRNDVLA